MILSYACPGGKREEGMDPNRERIRLAQMLRQHRTRSGYSQSQLGNILGVERSTYTYYETAKTIPVIFDLMRLADLYRLSLDDLLGFRHETTNYMYSPEDSIYQMRRQKDASKIREILLDLSPDERQLIAYFRSASEEERDQILSFLQKARRDERRRGPD